MKKVIHVLQALNVENDSRLLKYIRKQQELDYKVEILTYKFNNESDCCYYSEKLNCNVTQFQSFIKKYIPGKIGVFLKLFEQGLRIKRFLKNKKNDIIIIHDERFFILLLLIIFSSDLKKSSIRWDLRELPLSLINRIGLKILKFICNNICAVAHANSERLSYINSKYEKKLSNSLVINNFVPKNVFISKKRNLKLKKFTILIQSPTDPGRYFKNSIHALKKISNINVIVNGFVPHELKTFASINLSKHKQQKIDFIGNIDPDKIFQLIDNVHCSIILYNTKSLNNEFCAPNRLYQAIARDCPVIVGNNISLSKIVKDLNNGVVLNSDGRSTKDIYDGLIKMQNNYKLFSINLSKRLNYCWDNQQKTVINFLS
tara:strand:- start:924 stop:2042 length:1119 start_codon:yes stop_codon:yes gene_type:complete